MFSHQLAMSLANGEDLHGWKVPEALNVVYFDGEMPARDMRDRLNGMAGGEQSERLFTVNHELVFSRLGLSMNLTDPRWQNEVTRICQQHECKVLILDNLSSLCFGMEENGNDDWELMLPWLLQLRRVGIALIVVHHSGAAGARMRGGTRKEDHAFWII
jgi:putative DNA primase/helicase